MNLFLDKIHDTDLGTIYFNRNSRAKRINIRIHPDKLVVSLPCGASVAQGMTFVNQIREKLIKKKSRIETLSSQSLITEDNPLKTLTFEVRVRSSYSDRLFASLKSGILTIEYPFCLSVEDQKTQHFFWNSINYFLRKEAKLILPEQTKKLASNHGFEYSDVKIQSSKTRWGSCSSRRTINLSFYLLLLPQHLIDYVILHELCHTKEMNHSKRFWEWMDKVTDNQSDKLKSELKNYIIPQN